MDVELKPEMLNTKNEFIDSINAMSMISNQVKSEQTLVPMYKSWTSKLEADQIRLY